MKKHRVVVLAYDGLCTFEFGCVVEVFDLHRPELEVDWYDFAVCAAERGPLRAAGGIRVEAPYKLAMLDRADTIVIPGWRDADAPVPEAVLRKLRAAYKRGARLCSICSGVFVLAAAGILDGKRATTHWRYAEKLAARHPRISVDPSALYVDEGQVMTSAGSAAGLDMLLHLVRRDHGARIANMVAQRLVLPAQRDGGQAQFLPRPVAVEGDSRITRLMDWLRAHPAQPHTLEDMAARASMSVRTLQRQFSAMAGMAPGEWLVRERIGLVKEVLETSDAPLARIAATAGFGSEESLRHHFRRIVQTSPGAYRRRFAAQAPGDAIIPRPGRAA